MTGNDFVKFFLRTPLQAWMGNTMLITVTGRKTGRKYTTPVGFFRANGYLWVLTGRDRTWWRNACGRPVTLHLHGRDLTAFADLILDEQAVAIRLRDYLHHIPMAAGSLGVHIENGAPNPGDLARLAKDRLFVRILPDPQSDSNSPRSSN